MMKKQQKLLLQIDDDQLKQLCERVPLQPTDRKLAYAMAVLCAGTGAYAPDRGVGQREISQLAGVSLRTVKRRLKYLKRYGILSVKQSNGKNNIYHFSMLMLFDAPPLTHNIYQTIYHKSDIVSETKSGTGAVPVNKTNDRQQLLFEVQECAAPGSQDAISIHSWRSRIWRAATRFTKRLFSKRPDLNQCQTGTKPVPNDLEAVPDRCQTSANSGTGANEPVPFEAVGAETGAKPVPTTVQTSGEPVPNRCQTVPHDHDHDLEPDIKNIMYHDHDHEGLDSFSSEREETEKKNAQPLPSKRINWGGREIQDEDLEDPRQVQQFYDLVLEQGVLKHSENRRSDFFRLASFVSRYKKANNKGGLFSMLISRMADPEAKSPVQRNFNHDDDEWARKAIKFVDYPPINS